MKKYKVGQGQKIFRQFKICRFKNNKIISKNNNIITVRVYEKVLQKFGRKIFLKTF
jgi:hypothetical protein